MSRRAAMGHEEAHVRGPKANTAMQSMEIV
jgi:hypothetical protein